MSEDKPYNPMAHDSIDKLLASRARNQKRQAEMIEQVEEWKTVLNRLFSSPDGQYFLKGLIKYSKIHSFDNPTNPAKLVEDEGKRKVYLELIRPFLDKTILMEIVE